MKILLIGEYSNLHNSLKQGLAKLGHDVKIAGLNDGFKNIPVDLKIKKKYDNGFLKLLKNIIYKFSKIDLHSINVKRQIIKLQSELKNYDVIQFINETPFLCLPKTEKEIFNLLKKNNKKTFLLSCGTDHISIKHANDGLFRYSILTPYLNGETDFDSALKYLDAAHTNLHKHIYKNVSGVIASDIDYHIPLIGNEKYLGMIPNPINVELLPFNTLKFKDKIKIFHGINLTSKNRKGNVFFEKALAIIQDKYPNKVTIKTTENIPYKEYIKIYDEAHILLDQVYGFDQGYNALEAMAKGKVVFTGAEQEWLEFYNIKEDTVVINALPDVDSIVKKLEWLILNPENILEISKNARQFIENEHDYISSAKKYINTWTQ
ncbi:glycosyltransferase [Lacinutrix mariniflava]|uniref:glycosyltransferase n=1 Tax=Lacinutrix mariniflava TaxID=342955 RepID=UPI0006E28FFA|nr:glycosyltransferase [Lacinutrix mariniflava]